MHRLAVGTLVAASLVLGGCDRKPEKKESEHVSVSRDSGKITIQSDQGHAKVEIATEGGNLASQLPSFVPLYPGAKVQSRMQAASEGGKGGGIVYTAKAQPDAVIAFYRDKAKAEGMVERMVMRSEEAHILVAAAKDNKHSFRVSATPAEGGSQVSVFWSGD